MAKTGLAAITGRRYKIALDESWAHETPEVRTPDRIWYEQIPCQGGAFISVYSLDPLVLQIWTIRPPNAKKVWEAIKDYAGASADFVFDGEAVIRFPPEALSTVAELAGARKKRRLSPEARARLIEQGKAHRFLPQNHGVEGAEMAQG
jgi:hypothetical protein